MPIDPYAGLDEDTRAILTGGGAPGSADPYAGLDADTRDILSGGQKKRAIEEPKPGFYDSYVKPVLHGIGRLAGAPLRGIGTTATALESLGRYGDPLAEFNLRPEDREGGIAGDVGQALGVAEPAFEGKTPWQVVKRGYTGLAALPLGEERVPVSPQADKAAEQVSPAVEEELHRKNPVTFRAEAVGDVAGELGTQLALDPVLHGLGKLGEVASRAKAAEAALKAEQVLSPEGVAAAQRAIETAQAVPLGAETAHRVLGAAFIPGMAEGAYERATKELPQAVREHGWTSPEAIRAGLGAVADTAFVGLGALHAAGLHTPIEDGLPRVRRIEGPGPEAAGAIPEVAREWDSRAVDAFTDYLDAQERARNAAPPEPSASEPPPEPAPLSTPPFRVPERPVPNIEAPLEHPWTGIEPGRPAEVGRPGGVGTGRPPFEDEGAPPGVPFGAAPDTATPTAAQPPPGVPDLARQVPVGVDKRGGIRWETPQPQEIQPVTDGLLPPPPKQPTPGPLDAHVAEQQRQQEAQQRFAFEQQQAEQQAAAETQQAAEAQAQEQQRAQQEAEQTRLAQEQRAVQDRAREEPFLAEELQLRDQERRLKEAVKTQRDERVQAPEPDAAAELRLKDSEAALEATTGRLKEIAEVRKRGRLKEPPLDENGVRILPGEEHLPSGERQLVDVATEQALREAKALRDQERALVSRMRERLAAAAGRGRPLSEGVSSVMHEENSRGQVDQNTERIIEQALRGKFAGEDYKEGTLLEGVDGSLEEIERQLKKDRGNKKEMEVRQAIRENLANSGEEPPPEDEVPFMARRQPRQEGPGLFDQKLEEEPKREEPKPVEEPSPPDRPLPLKSIRRGQAVEGYYHDTPFRGVVSSVESDRSGYPGTERDGRIIVALSRDLTVYGGRRKAGEDSIVIAYSRGEQERDAITRIIPEDPGGEAPRTEPKPAPVTVPREAQISKPVPGHGGYSLVGYDWRSMHGEKWSEREGGFVKARVSDWDRSDTSKGTGRDIVHVYYIKHPDGTVTAEGIRSAASLLGRQEEGLRFIAKEERGKRIAAEREEQDIVAGWVQRAKTNREDAFADYAMRNRSPLRTDAQNEAVARDGVAFEQGGKYAVVPSERAELMERSGWKRVETPQQSLAVAAAHTKKFREAWGEYVSSLPDGASLGGGWQHRTIASDGSHWAVRGSRWVPASEAIVEIGNPLYDAAGVQRYADPPTKPEAAPATTIERTPAGHQRTLVSALDTTSKIKPASAFHESPLFNQEREAEARRVERSQGSLFDEEPSLMERKRDTSDLGFFSQLRRVVDDPKAPKAASGSDWKRFLSDPKRSVKAEELKWTGLDDFLKERAGQKVTRDEIAEFLRTHDVQVKEVTLGGGDLTVAARTATKFSQYQLPGGENYREVVLYTPLSDRVDFPSYDQWAADNLTDEARTPKYEAENRRVYESEKKHALLRAQGKEKRESFKSSHFPDVPGSYLAHMRLSDRIDADGKRVLLVDEAQSDAGQRGRKEGFREGRPEGVPAAPFIQKTEDWASLVMKRVLRMAAEGGYDRVAWTPGDVQAERYDLSKHIGKLQWDEDTGRLTAWDPEQKHTVIDESGVTQEKLVDYVGKDVADRMAAQEPDEDGSRVLSGLDLKVGGEGMRGFYDKILPGVVSKLGKKFGAKVGSAELPGVGGPQELQEYQQVFVRDAIESLSTRDLREAAEYQLSENDPEIGQALMRAVAVREVGGSKQEAYDAALSAREPMTLHSIDITPEMRASVMEGQPLFAERKSREAQRLQFWRSMASDESLPGHIRDTFRQMVKEEKPTGDRGIIDLAVSEAESTMDLADDHVTSLATGDRAARVAVASRIVSRADGLDGEEAKSIAALGPEDRREAKLLSKLVDRLRPDSPVYEKVEARRQDLLTKGAVRLEKAQGIVDSIQERAGRAADSAEAFLDRADALRANAKPEEVAAVAEEAKRFLAEKQARAERGYAFAQRGAKRRVVEAEDREKVPAGPVDIASPDEAHDEVARALGEALGTDGAKAVKRAVDTVTRQAAKALQTTAPEFAGFHVDPGAFGYLLRKRVRIGVVQELERAQERAQSGPKGVSVEKYLARGIVNIAAHEAAHMLEKGHGPEHVEAIRKVVKSIAGKPLVEIRAKLEAALSGRTDALGGVLDRAREVWGEAGRQPGRRAGRDAGGRVAPAGDLGGEREGLAPGGEGGRAGLEEAVPGGVRQPAEAVAEGAERVGGDAELMQRPPGTPEPGVSPEESRRRLEEWKAGRSGRPATAPEAPGRPAGEPVAPEPQQPIKAAKPAPGQPGFERKPIKPIPAPSRPAAEPAPGQPGFETGTIVQWVPPGGKRLAGVVVHAPDQSGRVTVRRDGGGLEVVKASTLEALGHLRDATMREPWSDIGMSEHVRQLVKKAGYEGEVYPEGKPAENTAPVNLGRLNLSAKTRADMSREFEANKEFYEKAKGGRVTFSQMQTDAADLAQAIGGEKGFEAAIKAGAPLSDHRAVLLGRAILQKRSAEVAELGEALREAVRTGKGKMEAEKAFLAASLERANFVASFRGAQAQAARALVAFKVIQDEHGPVTKLLTRLFSESC